jgi:hypothetical protein
MSSDWRYGTPGDGCKYRHALPPGFVLKSQRKKEEEDAKKKEITLEEFLEVEVRLMSIVSPPENWFDSSSQRHKLDQSKLTPLTLETFAAWKKTRMNKKEAEADLVKATKVAAHAVGKNNGMSGRDLFTFNPDLGADSDGEDEFDIQLLKIRADRERREAEIEGWVDSSNLDWARLTIGSRIREMDGHTGEGGELEDVPEEAEKEVQQEKEGAEPTPP